MTIIIRTYNRARLVSRAIESALGQAYPNLDVLVVDDGSTDDTRHVLARFEDDPRVRIVRHERNRGVTAALNTGLDHLGAGSLYFGVLDSDDSLEPGAVEALVRVFESSGDAYSMVLGWCRDMDSGAPTGRVAHLREGVGEITYDDALAGHFTGEFWHLARRDLLGDLHFEERARGAEGSVWWRMLRRRPGWLIPNVVKSYSTSGADRISVVSYTAAAARGMMWVQQAMLDAVGTDLRRSYPLTYGTYLLEMAKWAALAGDRRRARAASRQGLRFAPSPRALIIVLVALTPSQVLWWLAGIRSRLRRSSWSPG